MDKQFKSMQVKVELLSSAPPPPPPPPSSDGKDKLDASRLNHLLQNLKLELMTVFVKKEEYDKNFKDLEGKMQLLNENQDKQKTTLGNTEKKTNENTIEIDKLKDWIKLIEKEVKNKLNIEEYDKLLDAIRQMKDK